MRSARFRATTKARPRRPYHERHPSVDYSRPGGRWCIVSQCPECRQMAHDRRGYRSSRFYFNGTLIGKPPRQFRGWWARLCSECEWYSEQVTKVASCECCGRIKREGATGVDHRYDCRREADYVSPRLCVACWNRLRAVRKQLRELGELSREIERAVRARREAARAAAG